VSFSDAVHIPQLLLRALKGMSLHAALVLGHHNTLAYTRFYPTFPSGWQRHLSGHERGF